MTNNPTHTCHEEPDAVRRLNLHYLQAVAHPLPICSATTIVIEYQSYSKHPG